MREKVAEWIVFERREEIRVLYVWWVRWRMQEDEGKVWDPAVLVADNLERGWDGSGEGTLGREWWKVDATESWRLMDVRAENTGWAERRWVGVEGNAAVIKRSSAPESENRAEAGSNV